MGRSCVRLVSHDAPRRRRSPEFVSVGRKRDHLVPITDNEA